jgi:hypothetical protein
MKSKFSQILFFALTGFLLLTGKANADGTERRNNSKQEANYTSVSELNENMVRKYWEDSLTSYTHEDQMNAESLTIIGTAQKNENAVAKKCHKAKCRN